MSRRTVSSLVAAGITVLPFWLTGSPSSVARTDVAVSTVGGSVCYPTTDNGDPDLIDLVITPSSVDATSAEKTVTFTAVVTDTGGPGAASGIEHGRVSTGLGDVELALDASGNLVGSAVVERGERDGISYVSMVDLWDLAGNWRSLDYDDLLQRGVDAAFFVFTDPDTAAPALRSLHLSSTSVDSRRHPRHVTVRARITDARTGVTSAWVKANPPYGNFVTPPFVSTFLRRTSGTAADGVWSGTLAFDRWQRTASRRLTIRVRDEVGNRGNYTPRRLDRAGLPSRIRVRSGVDDRDPVLTLRSMRPTTIDLRQTTGSETFTITVRARDAQSGVSRIAWEPEYGFETTGFHRVSGTARDGIWRAVVGVPRCAIDAQRLGIRAWAVDRVGLADEFGTKPVLTVLNTDISRPSAGVVNGPVPPSGPVVVKFSEDVTGLDSTTGVVRTPGEVSTSQLVPGSWACVTSAGGPVDCLTGPVRMARFTPTAPMAVPPPTDLEPEGEPYVLFINPEHVLGVSDLAGNPLYSRDGSWFHVG